MPPLLLHLGAFAGYTLALLLLTGQAFAWNETRSLFYLGGRRTGMWMSLATFCATWKEMRAGKFALIAWRVW